MGLLSQLCAPPGIRVRDPYDSAPKFSAVLEELEPTIGVGAYALIELARDLDAFVDLFEGEHCNERENRRRLRTKPTEFAAAIPDLRETLLRLLELIRIDAPSADHLKQIGRRAHEVAIWAESRRAVITALTFAELAQEVDHDSGTPDPQLSFDLGRMAVAVPEFRQAGVACLSHAAAVARGVGRCDLAEAASTLAAQSAA